MQPTITRPQRYLVRMAVFLLIVVIACGVLFPRLREAFMANAVLNGMILGVALMGIAYIVRQVTMLNIEADWLERLRQESGDGTFFAGTLSDERPPRLLGPIAKMLRERSGRVTLSTLSMRSLLDSIQARIEESHEISRYLIGLLIFLGLLGTFWGLLITVDAVGETISGLRGTGNNPATIFDNLQQGLRTPLSGMGTAFSSSLFGLAGSLVLGFLELQAGQAHNRFVNDLEEWLSSVTRLSSSGPIGESDQPVPAYIQALLEQTADSLDNLQRTIARGEENRVAVSSNLMTLTDRLGTLTDQMRTEQAVLLRVAENQAQLKPLFMQLADIHLSSGGLDEATRDHIRNLDLHLARLVNEIPDGRDQIVRDVRSEIRLLARTIAALAEESEQG